jgi:hypothetical protein
MDTKKIKFFYDSFTSVIEEFAKTEAKKWNLDKVVAYPPNTKIDLNKLFEGDYLTYEEENHFDISKRRYPVSDTPIDLGFLDVNQVVEESQPKLYHRSDVKFAENLKILVNHNKIDVVLRLIKSGMDISEFYFGGYSNYFNGGFAHLGDDYTGYYIGLNMMYYFNIPLSKFHKYATNQNILFDDNLNQTTQNLLNYLMGDIAKRHDYQMNKEYKPFINFIANGLSGKLTWDDVKKMCKYLFKTIYVIKVIDNYNIRVRKEEGVEPSKKYPDYIQSFCNSIEKVPRFKYNIIHIKNENENE